MHLNKLDKQNFGKPKNMHTNLQQHKNKIILWAK